MWRNVLSVLLAVCFFLAAAGFPVGAGGVDDYDLVIVNARIVDGSGNPWFRGSIGVRDGKIVRIGRIDAGSAKVMIDAGNKIVAPGFIDVHTHVEEIFDNPRAENFVRMGVTSLVTGNCGMSAVDIGGFLGGFRTKPLAVNLATLVAHGAVREKVMGLENRAPTPDEQERMNSLVEAAMRDGAVGLSTGLIYVPGTFAKTDEVVALARASAKYGGVYASHIRDEGTDVVKSVEEAIDIGEQAGMPVEISHFKISSKKLWGTSAVTIGLVEAARQRGLSVTVDQYAYTASSTSLDARMPAWAIAGGREEGRKRLADPETRARVISEMKDELKKKDFKDFEFAVVANYPANPAFNGKNIREITKIARNSTKLDAQIEQIFEMYAAGGAGMIYHIMSEADVRNIMKQPFTMIASDSSTRIFGEGMPHPRGYGNNARVLGKYVRELKLLTIEDAIRKMTSLPAQTFNLRDRGLIREGFAADLVIFDENTIADKAVYDAPHQYATGIADVIVNGRIVFDGTKMTGQFPGRPLFGPGYGAGRNE
ncbi:MAG: D-aminoacylase [Acidobacteria bacterium]|nr:D-aminoacylase [Acidobacteriota bacterium]